MLLTSLQGTLLFLVPGCVENGKLGLLGLLGILGLAAHPQYHQTI